MDINRSSVSYTSILSEPPTKEQIVVYGVQVILLYLLIIVCLVNLSIPTLHFEDKFENLWIGLLSSSIGYLLPNPNLKNRIKTTNI